MNALLDTCLPSELFKRQPFLIWNPRLHPHRYT